MACQVLSRVCRPQLLVSGWGCHPPLWSICVQVSRGPAEWSGICPAAGEEGPRPLLHSNTQSSPMQGAHNGAALMTLPSGPLLLTMGHLRPPPLCRALIPQAPLLPLGITHYALPWSGPAQAQGTGGPRGPLNCTCHRVPSTQLVSCLPLCGSGDGAPCCPLSILSFHSAGSAGPGPLLSKGPCKYVHFSG